MKRREFLKSSAALAAGTAMSAPAIYSAEAQSRKETLLLVTENGPTISTSTGSAPIAPATRRRGIATTA